MKISVKDDDTVETEWYRKKTDTGMILNFDAIAPIKYKRNLVQGFVFTIFNACSNWKNFDTGIIEAKSILIANQYPSEFFDPIIEKTIANIYTFNKDSTKRLINSTEDQNKRMFFI